MKPSDYRAILRITDQENWGFRLADLRRMAWLEPNGCFVAAQNGSPVGFALAVCYGRTLGWIGNIIVDRKFRGRSIGKILVQRCVDYLGRRTRHVGLFSNPETVEFYKRLDFNRIGSFVRLAARPSATAGLRTGSKWQVAKPSARQLKRLISVDKEVFGASRTALLKRIRAEFPRFCLVCLNDARISGYVFGKAYKDSYEIGPLVTKPASADVASSLLVSCLKRMRRLPIEAAVPSENLKALRLFERYGFRRSWQGAVMYYDESKKLSNTRATFAYGFLDKG